MSAAERARGVVTASAGNHGQGVGLAASRLGVSATVVVPELCPPIKRDAIESVMTWLFTGLTLVGLLIQVGAAIWGDRLPERVHALRVYVALFVVTLMVAVVLVLLLNSLGNWLARARWLPQAVENQNDVYRSARFVIEHDGWRDDQLAVKATLPDPEHYRRGNFETAARQVEQIEKLLDIPVRTTDLKVRLDALKPFFERHQRGAR